MEGALRYTLFTLFLLFRPLTLFMLSKLIYTAQTVACMPMYLVLGRGRMLVESTDEQCAKSWVMDGMGDTP